MILALDQCLLLLREKRVTPPPAETNPWKPGLNRGLSHGLSRCPNYQPNLAGKHLKVAFMQLHAREAFMRSLALTAVAVMSAAAFGMFPQIRLGDCHDAGGISVPHADGTYWCMGGFYDDQKILFFGPGARYDHGRPRH
jgi:hypothetical protein